MRNESTSDIEGNKIIDGYISLLLEFIFTYFDFCLIFFFKYRKNLEIYDMLSYWLKSKNEIFKFYCDFKLLSFDKFNNSNDYKEVLSLILYLIDIMKITKEENRIEINTIDNDLFVMEINKFNEYRINDKKYISTLTFEKINESEKDNKDYNKLAIFCLDSNKNHSLIDIMDIYDLKRSEDKYELKTNQNLFFVPLKNIDTIIYTFNYSKNNITIYPRIYNYSNLRRHENLPIYSWNFGYYKNNFLIISEENNQIYTFKEEYLNKIDFIQNQQLNEINDKENKIIDIIESSINSCTFLLNQKNEIYCIDNRCYNKENNKNIKDIVYPFKIRIKEIHPQIKIKCIAASLKSIYIIDINGNLYESDEYFKDNNIKNNNELIENINSKWIKVISPLEESKFIDCACGNDHFVCIIKDSQGIGKLYAKGENGYYQCGVGKNNNRYIKKLVPCIITSNSSFKSVFANEDFSAAITFDNQLYIWGKFK